MSTATSDGTARFRHRHITAGLHPNSFRQLGRTGLETSVLGFGAYRVTGTEQHAAALGHALRSGINLIDTASHYSDGDSEQMVGKVVAKALQERWVSRDEVIIVSKVGYLQGKDLRQIRNQNLTAKYRDIVHFSPDLWHSLDPDFISDQLTATLERLQLSAIDVYLLNNPEFFLATAFRDSQSTGDHFATFYERIGRAFERLEKEVTRGRILYYGISSNGFALPSHHLEHVSIQRLITLSKKICGEQEVPQAPRFAVVSMPGNLLEPAAFSGKSESGQSPAAEAAMADLGVLVHRPLNALEGGGLVRLVDTLPPDHDLTLLNQIDELRHLEKAFRAKLLPIIAEAERPFAQEALTWSEWFGQAAKDPTPPATWHRLEQEVIRPALQQTFRQLAHHFKEEDLIAWSAWRNEYWPRVLAAVQVARADTQRLWHKHSQALESRLRPFIPPPLVPSPLATKVLAVTAGFPCVSAVLNGMRQKAYVDHALLVLRHGTVDLSKEIFNLSGQLD